MSTSWSSALCAVTERPCFIHVAESIPLYSHSACTELVQRECTFSLCIHFTHTMSLAFSLTHPVLSTALVTWRFIPSCLLHSSQHKEIAFETLTKKHISFTWKHKIFLFMWYISQSSCNSNFVLLRSTVEHKGQNGTVTFKVEKYEKCHSLGKKEESPATMTGCLLWWETEWGCTFQPWP